MANPVAVIRKNASEELRVGLDQFKGRDLFSARVWFDDNGVTKPGRNGLAFKVELLPAFAAAVTATLSEAKARGLIK